MMALISPPSIFVTLTEITDNIYPLLHFPSFILSFIRSTGREYALKIIKKSKCRGKVSKEDLAWERIFCKALEYLFKFRVNWD